MDYKYIVLNGKTLKMVEKEGADAWSILAGSSKGLEGCSQQDFPAFALFGRHAKFPKDLEINWKRKLETPETNFSVRGGHGLGSGLQPQPLTPLSTLYV